MNTILFFLFFFSLLITITYEFSGEISLYSDPTFCSNNEYLDVLNLKCVVCDIERNLKPTDDKLSCTCDAQSKMVTFEGAEFPKCEPCPVNEFPTADKWDCLPCHAYTMKNNTSSICEACLAQQIIVGRELNGSISDFHCVNCTHGTMPSADKKSCIPCSFSHNCSCPQLTHLMLDKMCVPREALVDWPDERSTYLIEYDSGVKIDSYFFRMNLRLAVYLCKLKNATACQMVANMCTMVMFRDDYKASPCKLFQDLKHIPTSDKKHLPWLFYAEGDAQTVLNRKKISKKYNLGSKLLVNKLNLTAVRFSVTGHFKGMFVASGSSLQLCPGSWASLDIGLQFGTRYQHSCKIPAKQLVQQHETEFFDLYLQYWEGGESILYAIPILTRNLKGDRGHDNQGSDTSQWMLTRRVFLVDKTSGVKSISEKYGLEEDQSPSVVRYLKSCEIRVKVLEEGRIYPPLFVADYGEITREDIEAGSLVTISFFVEYDMPSTLAYAIEVSMGTLCALAVVWSAVQTWSSSRRSGRVAIDLFTLLQLVLFTCGNLANVFFLVVASASLHTFIFYKGQSVVHLLLPGSKNEELIRTYVVIAFILKVVEVIHVIWKQISIDIFFIDWERPRARNSIQRPRSEFVTNGNEDEQPVSIWRTYFVANEWNEIQTTRKISLVTQLLVTVFLLKVVGVENWATTDPDLHTVPPEYLSTSPPSLICRFAVGVLVYGVVYLFQFVIMIGFYERYVKNGIQQFVDICSVANISVFILSLEHFGYYIHGRSAHGFADTDMQTILVQLQREEEDLCGHRGLVPGTDQQTFQMAVPLQLRSYYRKVMSPISSMVVSKRLSIAGSAGVRNKMASGTVDRSVQAYHTMNKFLAAYLEHALKDLEYEVREKLFTESLFDIEFTEVFDRGIFYSDTGHSFDNILFYGNEFMLATFDIMLFSFVEVLAQDFLLAAIITAIIAKIFAVIRSVGGRRNLARKTLIDERFLI